MSKFAVIGSSWLFMKGSRCLAVWTAGGSFFLTSVSPWCLILFQASLLWESHSSVSSLLSLPVKTHQNPAHRTLWPILSTGSHRGKSLITKIFSFSRKWFYFKNKERGDIETCFFNLYLDIMKLETQRSFLHLQPSKWHPKKKTIRREPKKQSFSGKKISPAPVRRTWTSKRAHPRRIHELGPKAATMFQPLGPQFIKTCIFPFTISIYLFIIDLFIRVYLFFRPIATCFIRKASLKHCGFCPFSPHGLSYRHRLSTYTQTVSAMSSFSMAGNIIVKSLPSANGLFFKLVKMDHFQTVAFLPLQFFSSELPGQQPVLHQFWVFLVGCYVNL